MSKDYFSEIIKYYKQLAIKIMIEENRLEIYKSELKSIVPEFEQNKLIKMKVQTENQAVFIEQLKKLQKDIAVALYGYATTMDNQDLKIFVLYFFQEKPNVYIQEKLKLSKYVVCKKLSAFKKELDSMIVTEKL